MMVLYCLFWPQQSSGLVVSLLTHSCVLLVGWCARYHFCKWKTKWKIKCSIPVLYPLKIQWWLFKYNVALGLCMVLKVCYVRDMYKAQRQYCMIKEKIFCQGNKHIDALVSFILSILCINILSFTSSLYHLWYRFWITTPEVIFCDLVIVYLW